MTAFDADAHPVVEPEAQADLDAEANADFPLRERRKHERKPTRELVCLLGEVLDISEGGALLHHRGKFRREIGDVFAVLLRHESLCVTARMRLARVERVGFRRFNLGVEFVGLSEQQRIDVSQIAAAAHDAFVGPQAFVEAA